MTTQNMQKKKGKENKRLEKKSIHMQREWKNPTTPIFFPIPIGCIEMSKEANMKNGFTALHHQQEATHYFNKYET